MEKMQTSCIFVASSFVIDPQILIFSEFNIASFPVLNRQGGVWLRHLYWIAFPRMYNYMPMI